MTKQLENSDRIPDYEDGSYFSTKVEDLQEWADRARISLEEWCFYQREFRSIIGKIDRGTSKFSLKDCLLQVLKRSRITREYLEKQDAEKTD